MHLQGPRCRFSPSDAPDPRVRQRPARGETLGCGDSVEGRGRAAVPTDPQPHVSEALLRTDGSSNEKGRGRNCRETAARKPLEHLSTGPVT